MEVKPLDISVGYGAKSGETQVRSEAVQPKDGETVLKLVENKKKDVEFTSDDVRVMTEALNKFMQALEADLQFAMHDKTQQLMVRLVDTKDHKVLKEFPSSEFLDVIAKIRDYVGALLDKKV